jgi:uncharacterized protein
MFPTEFTPVTALLGGGLIGLSAALLMLLQGRIAGISGIAVFALPPWRDGFGPGRLAFIAGLLLAPLLWWAVQGQMPGANWPASEPGTLVAGGLLVGFGAVLGNGCTSGHGICGLSRLSARSAVAVATFMATAIATVFVVRHVIGG